MVGYGMVSLVVDQKAPRACPDLCELKLANGIDESASVGRLRHGIPHCGAEGTDERVLRARAEAREWD